MADEASFEELLEQLRTRNPQWAAFVEAYLTHGYNATQAALAAGYAESSASVQGHRLIRNDKISPVIQAGVRQAQLSADEVLARMSQHAQASLAPFLELGEGGVRLRLDSERAQQALPMIRKLRLKGRVLEEQSGDDYVVLDQDVQLELHDASKALDQLARVHGLYHDSLEVTGPGGPPTPEEREETRRVRRSLGDLLERYEAKAGGEEE